MGVVDGRGRDADIEPKQALWMVKNILKAKQYIIDAGINLSEILDMENFYIKKLYMMLRGEQHKIP